MARDPAISLSAEDRQRLLKEVANPANRRLRLACWAILLLADGRPRKAVACECKVHPVTVARWIARLRKQGVAGLLGQKPVQGRRSKLAESHLELLRQAALTLPKQLGKPFNKWTLERLARYFAAQTGIVIRSNYLGRLLRRRGISWSRVGSIDAPGLQEREVLWLTVVRKSGSGSVSSKEERGYLFAAINLANGHVTSLNVRRRSSLSFAHFLNRLVHHYPKAKILLIGERESLKITQEVLRTLKSHQDKACLALIGGMARSEKNLGWSDSHPGVQFLAGSPDVVVSQLRSGLKQIEQLFGL